MSICPKELELKTGSPGLLLDSETVILVNFDPDNTSEGKVKVTSKSSFKKIKKSDYSIVRRQYSSAEQIIEKVISPQIASGNRKFVGVSIALTKDIRSITDNESNRVLCVYDDPVEDFSSHATIGVSEATKKSKYWESQNSQATVFRNLMLLFEERGILSLELVMTNQ